MLRQKPIYFAQRKIPLIPLENSTHQSAGSSFSEKSVFRFFFDPLRGAIGQLNSILKLTGKIAESTKQDNRHKAHNF